MLQIIHAGLDNKWNWYIHSQGQKLKGPWLNEVFLKTFASHYNKIGGACKVDAFGDPKLLCLVGAVGLCTASITSLLFFGDVLTNWLTG